MYYRVKVKLDELTENLPYEVTEHLSLLYLLFHFFIRPYKISTISTLTLHHEFS